jgi:hypothetical protein
MRLHLYRSERSTWCGLQISKHPNLAVTRAIMVAVDPVIESCKTCIKADAAEQRKQDEASRG